MITKNIFLIALIFMLLTSFQQSTGDSSMAHLWFSAQATGGEVTFNFTTLPNGATFSPRHVLAVWVEDETGNFVKSLKVQAEKRKQYLYTWNSKSSGNVTDAVTGATLTSHESHQVVWNRTNSSGLVVADGNYRMVVEYTSEHAQGPMLAVDFIIGATDLSLTPPDETYFTAISLTYQAVTCPTVTGTISSPSCHGNTDGAIHLEIQVTDPPYTILWSTGDTTLNLEGLGAGTYEVTVSGQSGCATPASFTLTEPLLLSVQDSVTGNTCAGDSMASITATAQGGTPPYAYEWSNGESGSTLQGLPQGTYTVTISDAGNCTLTQDIQVTDPEKPMIGQISGESLVDESVTFPYTLEPHDNSNYSWLVTGGEIISGQGTHSVLVQWGGEANGIIRAVEETSTGCLSDTASLQVSIQPSGTPIRPELSFQVLPNPVRDLLIIHCDSEVIVSVYDNKGAVMTRTQKKEVDFSHFRPGIYSVLVTDQDGNLQFREKVMKIE